MDPRFDNTLTVPAAELFCKRPFEHFEIQHNGLAYLCCPSWLPTPLGEVSGDDPGALWNGQTAQSIRESILDGSFRHCTGGPFLTTATGPVQLRTDVTDPVSLEIIRDRKLVMERIGWLNLAYDRSCNLSCPTCRTEPIVTTGET